MNSLGVQLSFLFSLYSCAFSVEDSWLQPKWIEDLKNEGPPFPSQHVLNVEDTRSLNSKGSNVILSVTRAPEEDVTDVYSLEDNEHDNTTDVEHTEQDDIPIIISSEPVQEEVIETSSTECSEQHINSSEVVPLDPISLDEVVRRLDKMVSQIKAQERLITELRKNNKNLKDKFNQIDRKTKVNNVIFINIRESKRENYKSLLQKVIQILNRMMRLTVSTDNIAMASRINGRSTDRFRPVLVKFTNLETKFKVLAARHKLKNSQFAILEDYSDLVNQKRQLLIPFLYEKRRQGHKVSMVQDTLIINGVKKTLSDLRQESNRKSQPEDKKPKDFEDKNPQEEHKKQKKINMQ